MNSTIRQAGTLIAAALIISIITQIFYMVTLGGPQPSDPAVGITNADVVAYFTDRWSEVATVWTIELAAFAVIAVAALTALTRGAAAPVAWAALFLAATFNILQVGIGLSMFRPAALAGEALAPVFLTVVAGAFLFYFFAKALIALAGIGLGIVLLSSASTAAKVAGILSIAVGLIAAALNIYAIPQGMGFVFPAGAAGTAAALTTGIAAWMATRRTE
ncbi:hypothetical protein [Parasphingopyxis lamellibrachiae]|uniref:Uncharacterized protein n=1 Tax=Parasphingopyxis lamellibrachiae TaxID=680125 RepID=A0A3D9FDJ4_9SPHN|nr:hypothetical protein [Parasphingopyxis lamellibrachiae]RED15894.1 hypothetical protein DFR46_0902 [Parasphingopyxis lamellibrachiae]